MKELFESLGETTLKKEVELIFPLLRGNFTLSQIKLLSILILFVCFDYFEINDFELKIFRILSF